MSFPRDIKFLDQFFAAYEQPAHQHLSKGEIADLRKDVRDAFARVEQAQIFVGAIPGMLVSAASPTTDIHTKTHAGLCLSVNGDDLEPLFITDPSALNTAAEIVAALNTEIVKAAGTYNQRSRLYYQAGRYWLFGQGETAAPRVRELHVLTVDTHGSLAVGNTIYHAGGLPEGVIVKLAHTTVGTTTTYYVWIAKTTTTEFAGTDTFNTTGHGNPGVYTVSANTKTYDIGAGMKLRSATPLDAGCSASVGGESLIAALAGLVYGTPVIDDAAQMGKETIGTPGVPANTVTVTLPRAFSGTDYSVLCAVENDLGVVVGFTIDNATKAVGAFTVLLSAAINGTLHWHAFMA